MRLQAGSHGTASLRLLRDFMFCLRKKLLICFLIQRSLRIESDLLHSYTAKRVFICIAAA